VQEKDIMYRGPAKSVVDAGKDPAAEALDGGDLGVQDPLTQEDVEGRLQRSIAALKDTSAAVRRGGLQEIRVGV
jgi:hypothetical protein